MRIKANVFVCSKPLQYFNVRNLINDNDKTDVLIIENRFNEANKFFQNVLQYDKHWNKVFFVNNRFETFKVCVLNYKVNNFFYYLDWHSTPAFLLYALPAQNAYIYEEGVGTYRTDIFSKMPRFKKWIRRLLGVSEYPGFHPKVKGVLCIALQYIIKFLKALLISRTY